MFRDLLRAHGLHVRATYNLIKEILILKNVSLTLSFEKVLTFAIEINLLQTFR